MFDFFRIIQHLLPRAKAWSITATKNLRSFFEGLANFFADVKTATDEPWVQLDPQTTTSLDEWEDQFGLPNSNLTEQQRRDRLEATWKFYASQSPNTIQSVLRAYGFDVYVHEWWTPGTEPPVNDPSAATPRSPLAVLRSEYTGVTNYVACGESFAECGEAVMEAGETSDPRGYPLVNKLRKVEPLLIPVCGEAAAQCGEAEAEAGNYTQLFVTFVNYTVPSDPATWPYFLYIGADTYPNIAQVDPKRKDEFEDLCLKICPAHLWLGVLVEYN